MADDTSGVISADPIIVNTGIDPNGIVRENSPRRQKSEIVWRDAANNIWKTKLYEGGPTGGETSDLELVSSATPGVLPAGPVPVPVCPYPPMLIQELKYVQDVGLKSRLSPKSTSGVKTGQIYWRDLANNLWLTESFEDIAKETFSVDTLIAAAVQGVPPAVPVVSPIPTSSSTS